MKIVPSIGVVPRTIKPESLLTSQDGAVQLQWSVWAVTVSDRCPPVPAEYLHVRRLTPTQVAPGYVTC